VILNETMIGGDMLEIQKILPRCNVYLSEVHKNFNFYSLPENYTERDRANEFLLKNNIKLGILSRSSSSNLYVFKTSNPNLDKLKGCIDYSKIYTHYL